MSALSALPVTGLHVVSRGQAGASEPGAVRGKLPLMYGDPVSWLVTEAVSRALAAGADQILTARDDVGVILVSARCTLKTMREVRRSSATGRVSPMRFTGASPGSAGSLVCMVHRLTGPTLTLVNDPAVGLGVAATIARAWLVSKAAAYVVVTAHEVSAAGEDVAESVVVSDRQQERET
ncbi:hypothetical protein [Micromonospora sp. NPDC050276]|uniref:hypothetical protein n=1 Tax=Micromonospora sp. NPDC050276 TaxID=3364278 RepID=UPI0037A21AF4